MKYEYYGPIHSKDGIVPTIGVKECKDPLQDPEEYEYSVICGLVFILTYAPHTATQK